MPKDEQPAGPYASRREPFWLNPATTKGTVAIAVGAFVLVAPTLSASLLRVLLSTALVVAGLSNLWFAIRQRARSRGVRTVAESLVMLLFGFMLILVPTATLRTLVVLSSIYLATRGITIFATAIRARLHRDPWGIDGVRGLLYLIVAAVLLVMPEGIVEALIAALAAGGMIVGAIMFVHGVRERSDEDLVDLDVASVSDLINKWLQERDVGTARRDEIGDGLFLEEPGRRSKIASWWVMLLLSVAIATLGVVQDSTAVVIGAMLIAPLMTPILGTSAGIVNVWRGRVGSSAALVLAGAGAAIGLAFIIGQWVPIIVPLDQNSQVISRVNPNVIDMMIALAAGAAGAYANVDDRVSDSIAGVAIAVALVPPLGVVGLTLQAGMFSDSLGSLLLFLTNLVSIILAASVVFFLTGYAPYNRIRQSRKEIAVWLRAVALAAIVIAIPLSLTAEDVLAETARQSDANEAVSEWLEDTSLEIVRIDVAGNAVEVFISGPGEVPSLSSLESDLSAQFEEQVELTVEHAPTTVITSPPLDP